MNRKPLGSALAENAQRALAVGFGSASQIRFFDLLAFCAALSLNGIKTKNDAAPTRLQHADAVATALNMDMRNWFTPTADNFFSKVSKPHILEAMTEAGKAPNSNAPAKLKKGPLAELAEKTLAGTGWLPEPIRIAPAQPEDNSFAQLRRRRGGEPHRTVVPGLESPFRGSGRARSHGIVEKEVFPVRLFLRMPLPYEQMEQLQPCRRCDGRQYWFDGRYWRCSHCLPTPLEHVTRFEVNQPGHWDSSRDFAWQT